MCDPGKSQFPRIGPSLTGQMKVGKCFSPKLEGHCGATGAANRFGVWETCPVARRAGRLYRVRSFDRIAFVLKTGSPTRTFFGGDPRGPTCSTLYFVTNRLGCLVVERGQVPGFSVPRTRVFAAHQKFLSKRVRLRAPAERKGGVVAIFPERQRFWSAFGEGTKKTIGLGG